MKIASAVATDASPADHSDGSGGGPVGRAAPAVAVAARAKALGDPTRLTLALALREGGEPCVCDLAWIAGTAENLVGHHLRALRAAGLPGSRRDGRIVFYRLTGTGRALLDAHTGAPQARA